MSKVNHLGWRVIFFFHDISKVLFLTLATICNCFLEVRVHCCWILLSSDRLACSKFILGKRLRKRGVICFYDSFWRTCFDLIIWIVEKHQTSASMDPFINVTFQNCCSCRPIKASIGARKCYSFIFYLTMSAKTMLRNIVWKVFSRIILAFYISLE